MFRSFLIALQFLTCIPVSFQSPPDDRQMGYSALYYPLIGLIIGVLLILIGALSHFSHPLLIASLILLVWVIITGGLHLDGLADTADAWMGGMGSRERTLQIMKDPCTGSIGTISLILILLVKFSALYTLLINDSHYWLIIPPVIGRTIPLLLFLGTSYVRKGGIGEHIAMNFPKKRAWAVCIITLLIPCLIKPVLFIPMVLACITFLLCWRHLLLKRIGGFTGDTVGALIECIESMCLIIIAAFF